MLLIGSLLLGAATLQEFSVALLIGLMVGGYSSIFVAAPIVVALKEREPRYRDAKDRAKRLRPARTPSTVGAAKRRTRRGRLIPAGRSSSPRPARSAATARSHGWLVVRPRSLSWTRWSWSTLPRDMPGLGRLPTSTARTAEPWPPSPAFSRGGEQRTLRRCRSRPWSPPSGQSTDASPTIGSSGPIGWRPRRTKGSAASRVSRTSHHPLAVARIVAELGLDETTIAAALLHDSVEDTGIELDDLRQRLRRRRGRDRRRCHQARTGQVRHQGGAAGGHHAQDAGGDGQGPPGHHHQAGRPAPQPPHHRRAARLEAGPHRPRDPRCLCPAGPPAGHAGDQDPARGPVLRRPASRSGTPRSIT